MSKFGLPEIKTNKIDKGNGKMSLKDLVGKKVTKTVKFMGEDIKISKLSVSEVMSIQEKARTVEADAKSGEDQGAEGFAILKLVIRSAVADVGDLSDDDFDSFPMDELSKLSAEIMKFSGLGNVEAGKQA